MNIEINGNTMATRAQTVAEAIEQHSDHHKVATALNGQFIPADKRAQTALHEGDRLEILAPMQGG